MGETTRRLLELAGIGAGPAFIAINMNEVVIEDLIRQYEHPGGIVRCNTNPAEAIKFMAPPTRDEVYDSIASWISENV